MCNNGTSMRNPVCKATCCFCSASRNSQVATTTCVRVQSESRFAPVLHVSDVTKLYNHCASIHKAGLSNHPTHTQNYHPRHHNPLTNCAGRPAPHRKTSPTTDHFPSETPPFAQQKTVLLGGSGTSTTQSLKIGIIDIVINDNHMNLTMTLTTKICILLISAAHNIECANFTSFIAK